MEKIVIAADHAGFKLKEKLKAHLKAKGLALQDAGTYSEERCDYPKFASLAAKGVAAGIYKRGILICKSGIGNSIVANKFPGVRAALCYDPRAARLSREHNDSNILVLGSGFVSAAVAKKITDIWLAATFLGGRYQRRLSQIKRIEKQLRKR